MDASLLFTFLIGFCASIVSGIAGGGAGFVVIPLLILLGLDPKIAAATSTLGAIGMGIGTLSRFSKSRELIRPHIIPFTVISLVSGVLGAFLLIAMPTEYIRIFVGTMIAFFLPLFLFKKNAGLHEIHPTRLRSIIGYILYTTLLTIQAAFGSGTGVGIVYILVFFFGFTMIQASATLRLPQLVSSLVTLPFFIAYGVLDYTHGLVLFVSMVIGGYIGSHIAIKKGNRFVKTLFVILAIILAVSMLLK